MRSPSGSPAGQANVILDADLRLFFDEVSRDWLIRFVERRTPGLDPGADPRIIRLIQKWLKAGVLEDGIVTVSAKGTGQGSAISPLLANISLHDAFDLWAENWRQREAAGDRIIVRLMPTTSSSGLWRATIRVRTQRRRRPALLGCDA